MYHLKKTTNQTKTNRADVLAQWVKVLVEGELHHFSSDLNIHALAWAPRPILTCVWKVLCCWRENFMVRSGSPGKCMSRPRSHRGPFGQVLSGSGVPGPGRIVIITRVAWGETGRMFLPAS